MNIFSCSKFHLTNKKDQNAPLHIFLILKLLGKIKKICKIETLQKVRQRKMGAERGFCNSADGAKELLIINFKFKMS